MCVRVLISILANQAWTVVDTRPLLLRAAPRLPTQHRGSRNGSANSNHLDVPGGHDAPDDDSSEGFASIHDLMGAIGAAPVPHGGGVAYGAGEEDEEEEEEEEEDDDADWVTDDDEGEADGSEVFDDDTTEGQLHVALRHRHIDAAAAGQWPLARAFVSCVVVPAADRGGGGASDRASSLDALWLFGGGNTSTSGSNFGDGWRLRPQLWVPRRHAAFARSSRAFHRAVWALLLVHARQGSGPGRLDKWTWLGALEFVTLAWFDAS
jgi:hypothetical protein